MIEKYTKEYWQERGRKGGNKTLSVHGRNYFKKIRQVREDKKAEKLSTDDDNTATVSPLDNPLVP